MAIPGFSNPIGRLFSNMKRHIDCVFRAMAHPLRREVLCLLARRDGGVAELADLSERLADRVPGRTDELQTVLYHDHIPQLREAGLVEFDARTGTVRCRDVPVSGLVGTALADHRALRKSQESRTSRSRI